MTIDKLINAKQGIKRLGLTNLKKIHWNSSTPELYEHAIKNDEGMLTHLGPLLVNEPGKSTCRSPNDKFIVLDENTADKVDWGKINVPYNPEKFNCIFERVKAYLQDREVYVQDSYAGADKEYRVGVRVITELAWQSLFARNMLFQIRDKDELNNFVPEFNVVVVPKFTGDPKLDGLNSEAFILINLTQKVILIGGTYGACEIKKSIFTALNYLLPQEKVLSMHCSANIGEHGDTALFFGLSGTGKTTLSSSPDRALIGDDEHGWSDKGVFNIEGGCYAKVIHLSKEAEPAIYKTTRRFGTVLENVITDPKTRSVDLDDSSITENTRAAYPLTHLDNMVEDSKGNHPENIFLLTADAFGVLPPISKLTVKQAADYFLLGYTAKIPGSEAGITKPVATFSSCFGEPFMPLRHGEYAKLLSDKIKKHNVKCWLVSTGWVGGSYGVGFRIPIKYTRALLKAALDGTLNDVEYTVDQFFGLVIPLRCPGVPKEILIPGNTWDSKESYEKKAKELSEKFKEKFKQ